MARDAQREGIERLLEEVAGARPTSLEALAEGRTGPVLAAVLPAGPVVVKLCDDLARHGDALLVEARALRFLCPHGPFPRVVAADRRALVLERLPGRAGTQGGGRALAAAVAALHDVTAPRFGFDEDTRIGGLVQRNTWSTSWTRFFAEHRLCAMARDAHAAGTLPARTLARVEALADRVGDVVDEPDAPRLVHGDLWSGNVLVERGAVTGLLDPAPCFADAEVDLALLELFGVDDAFWPAYFALRPPRPGRERRALAYRLWPLLVHVRLFDPPGAPGGGGYVRDVERTLAALGA